MKKSCLVILDANIVINAHEEKYWKILINAHKIYLPSIVIHDEVQYFSDRNNKNPIKLAPLIEQGLITEISASMNEVSLLQTRVKTAFFPSFDPGELEALALLVSGNYKNFLFCTGDGLAIKGLSILGLSSQGVSVEKLLAIAGDNRILKKNFTEKWFQEKLIAGFQEKNLWIN